MVLITSALCATAGAGTSISERGAWFREARFGMFIHWGIYSIPAKGEWSYANDKYAPGEYEANAKRFNPVNYNPREWAKLAKSAGMKYAFRAEGLKVGLYHSLPDWTHPGYADTESPECIRGGKKTPHVPTPEQYAAVWLRLHAEGQQSLLPLPAIPAWRHDFAAAQGQDREVVDLTADERID